MIREEELRAYRDLEGMTSHTNIRLRSELRALSA